MDYTAIKIRAGSFWKKYRYVMLILLIGLVLMLIPESSQKKETEETASQEVQTQPDLAYELASILSRIDGVGEVKVMLTVAEGEQTIYQYDETCSGGETGNISRETVIITDSSRGQSALIDQIIPPKYRGAIIVCEGGDKASVQLNIMEAVSAVTGLGMDKITVLKMN